VTLLVVGDGPALLVGQRAPEAAIDDDDGRERAGGERVRRAAVGDPDRDAVDPLGRQAPDLADPARRGDRIAEEAEDARRSDRGPRGRARSRPSARRPASPAAKAPARPSAAKAAANGAKASSGITRRRASAAPR
jgi:hypothetical protein